MERAYWLTTKVETGATFGTVIAYDGTGMTAGPDQHIAVYPAELAHEDFNAVDDQGGLWKLLRRLETGGEAPADYYHLIGELWEFFRSSMGAYVAQDGVLRYLSDGQTPVPMHGAVPVKYKAGAPVYGFHIRAALTPTPGEDIGAGRVPQSGKEWEAAAHVAMLFHKLMTHPNSRQIQLEFGKEHLVKRSRRSEVRDAYEDHELTSLRVGQGGWTEAVDLAMCVFQSHSVNAPAIAVRLLTQVHRALTLGDEFARALLEELGNSTFGRWDDDLPTGRYQRTRKAALESGLWSRGLFEGSEAIMPKDLPEFS